MFALLILLHSRSALLRWSWVAHVLFWVSRASKTLELIQICILTWIINTLFMPSWTTWSAQKDWWLCLSQWSCWDLQILDASTPNAGKPIDRMLRDCIRAWWKIRLLHHEDQHAPMRNVWPEMLRKSMIVDNWHLMNENGTTLKIGRRIVMALADSLVWFVDIHNEGLECLRLSECYESDSIVSFDQRHCSRRQLLSLSVGL